MFQHLDDRAQRLKPLYSEPVTTKPYLVPSLSNCPNHTWLMSGRNRKAGLGENEKAVNLLIATIDKVLFTEYLQWVRQMHQQPIPLHYRPSATLKKRLNRLFPAQLNSMA